MYLLCFRPPRNGNRENLLPLLIKSFVFIAAFYEIVIKAAFGIRVFESVPNSWFHIKVAVPGARFPELELEFLGCAAIGDHCEAGGFRCAQGFPFGFRLGGLRWSGGGRLGDRLGRRCNSGFRLNSCRRGGGTTAQQHSRQEQAENFFQSNQLPS